ncbi:hypothetical protein FisN_17Lh158 [Fistulifera solaris]|uniref:Uncharacterized protein n=1 Tax=Fistulifera solaris TaxID=1519565 RepID=A0A1Z5K8P5_FISSO|nr:hypothetical protein FisN_17Lh158 [Fistulifera solaris]|eukprot:GAX22663.1 hypothetical protein FisN_17Lh158 [Fistulifera solaris]
MSVYGIVGGILVGMVVGVLAMSTHGSTWFPFPRHSRLYTSKYAKVQGIGFQIYTGGAPAFLDRNNTGPQNPECIGLDSYGEFYDENGLQYQCYLGLEDPIDDVRVRIQLMKDAIEKAYDVADHNPSILKVFIAPEFYWRGIDGAYIMEDEEDYTHCGPICDLMLAMEEFVADPKYQDWLFLMGTVIASQVLPEEDPYNYLFYNFALLYKGYDPAKQDHTGKRYLVPKRIVSGQDFLLPRRFMSNQSAILELLAEDLPETDNTLFIPFGQNKYDVDAWDLYKVDLHDRGYHLIYNNWFLIDGISMTCEICFDHDQRRAKNTYMADMVSGRSTLIPSYSDENGFAYVNIPEYQAQISLVSSAGMTVTEDSLVLTNGGVIFLQDGQSNAANDVTFGNVAECDGFRQDGYIFTGGTQAVQREAVVSYMDALFEFKSLHNFEKYSIWEHWEKKLDGVFSAALYEPQLAVYEPVEIAQIKSNQRNHADF